ncbi:MAG: hypothetical protein ACIAXF_10130 [Phycisphaerales bacterium JB063]
MQGFAIKTLALLALVSLSALTGCVTEREPRRSIEPTWSYHDRPDPLAYSDVWDQPGGLSQDQVVQAFEDQAR